MKSHISVKAGCLALLFVLIVIFGGSCGGGGGDDGTTPQVNTVSVSGSVNTPPGANITAVHSATGSSTVNPDGTFTVELIEGAVQLVLATDSLGNPVLMNIAIDARANKEIVLDAESTAEALLFLSPGVAQRNPDDADTVIALIRSLPETADLTAVLADKIAQDPDVLASPEGDPEIIQAISTALQALISEATSQEVNDPQSIENPIGSLSTTKNAVLNPSSASGLFVSFNEDTKGFSAENGAKRHVEFYEVHPTDQLLFSLESVSILARGIAGSFIGDFIGSTSQGRTSGGPVTIDDFNPSTPVTIKAYGLGFRDAPAVFGNATNEDITRILIPASKTVVFDIAVPVISTLFGIDVGECGEGAFLTFAGNVNANISTSPVIDDLANGNSRNFFFEGMKIVYDSLSVSLLTEIAQDCAVSVFRDFILSLAAPFKLLKSFMGAGDIIAASFSVGFTRAIENFTISSSPATAGFAYVAAHVPDLGNGLVLEYQINTDGSLLLIGTIAGGDAPTSITADPSGRFVYMVNRLDATISEYSVGTDGFLTPVGTAAAGISPWSIVVDPSGRFVYVTAVEGLVLEYQINTDGSLTQIGTIGAGRQPLSIAVDPLGRFAYVTNSLDNTVSGYAINADGSLTAIGTVSTGSFPFVVAVDPAGKFAYVTNDVDNNVSQYRINTDGSPTQIGIISTGNGPAAMVVDPSGQFAYVANSVGNSVSEYTINVDGSLTSIGTISAGLFPFGMATDSSGTFLYVTNSLDDTISQYTINTDGSLTLIGIVDAEEGPFAITTARPVIP